MNYVNCPTEHIYGQIFYTVSDTDEVIGRRR